MDDKGIRCAFLVAGWGLALSAAALAQVPTTPVRRVIQTSSGGVVTIQELRPGIAPPQDPADAAAADSPQDPATAVDPKVMQAFQRLEFDRRPSAILAAWAAPEPLGIDEDPALALPPEPPPAPEAPDPEAGDEAAAAYQQARAEHQKLVTEHNARKQAVEQQRQQRRMEILARDVTLGRWDRLPAFLQDFGEAGAAYEQLLQKLPQPPRAAQQGVNNQVRAFIEQNSFDFEDILDLVAIAPGGFQKKHAQFLPPLLNLAFAQGHGFPDWLERLHRETARPEAERRVDRRLAALFLAAQQRDLETGGFLPSLEEAVASGDREALNLLARHHLARHRKERSPRFLEAAWTATLAALAAGDIDEEQKADALRRAVSLAPRVRDELGEGWLEESFTERPERGMEVLATIGGQASRGMVERAGDPEFRLQGLQLLGNAVRALLESAPERAGAWRDTLNLLANVWLREAQHSYRFSTADSMGPVAQLDPFGNIYWVNRGGSRNVPVRPIEPGALLELRPSGRWREMLEGSVRPRFDTTIAELYLKVNEEKLAFPYIEQLAETEPETANQLAREFLEVWIRNNDPNSTRNFTNVYNFAYGYSARAAAIPLTRSKQERSLRDLAHWVSRLRGVPGIELDTALLVRAFTSSHSAAEVYRIETMESVFGTLEDLDPKTLAQMAQTMRANLATTWRIPAVQQQAGTRRRQSDIEVEVLKGYATAQAVLGRALQVHPDHWSLLVARAAMIHDLNNFQNEIAETSDFAAVRRQALELFGRAARSYAALVPELPEDEESIEAFEFWFQAALGASDLNAIDERTRLARDEIPKIARMLDSIPGGSGERHRSRFANALFTKLSAVNPAIKNRYLEAGFAIVGDHPQARAARKVYEYYKDLLAEIRLVADVDGPADVGTEPFGVRVELHYTVEIERESGGFSKYLQNQANAVNPIYNYGRPPENYRDRFEEAVRTTLSEHFEVHSVTFNSEDVGSKATGEFGWRRTPYAYLLLAAKGPEVDRIPPMKIDLDFLDVTGYAVLPITSAVVPIDASAEAAGRPFADLQVTQILDERKATDGLLTLEIKAQATGLVPELEAVLELSPSDFEVRDIEDAGVSVSQFGDDRDSIRSERLWVVSMRPREDVANATAFRFAMPVIDDCEVLYQRYDDADLVTAAGEVELAGRYAGAGPRWWWFALPLVALLGFVLWRRSRPAAGPQSAELRLPERITPFTVIGLLDRLRGTPGLGDAERAELDETIGRIERYYFGDTGGEPPDLDGIVSSWVRRA